MDVTAYLKHPAFDAEQLVNRDEAKARRKRHLAAVRAFEEARVALAEAAAEAADDLRLGFWLAKDKRDDVAAQHGVPSAMVKRATTPGDPPAVLSTEDVETVHALLMAQARPVIEPSSE